MGMPQGMMMSSQSIQPAALERARSRIPMVLLGLGLALAGVAVVEALIALGARPLTPIGWPSLGMIAAAGVGGLGGLVGGAIGVVGYYVVNLAQPERFALFYVQAANLAQWGVAVTALSGAALLVRPRLLRLAAAEAEVIARRKYEAALLESEEQAREAK